MLIGITAKENTTAQIKFEDGWKYNDGNEWKSIDQTQIFVLDENESFSNFQPTTAGLYIDKNKEVKYWSAGPSAEFLNLSVEIVDIINSATDDEKIPTVAAIKNYFSPYTGFVIEASDTGTEKLINHNLNTLTPGIIIYKETDGKYQQVTLPFSITDANNINIDTTEVQRIKNIYKNILILLKKRAQIVLSFYFLLLKILRNENQIPAEEKSD